MAKRTTKGHAEQRHGADRGVRPAALRVFPIHTGVPPDRAACVDGPRPCSFIKCRHHLYLELGTDRPGRRVDGRAPLTTVRAAWLDVPVPPSCALDVADAVAARGEAPEMRELARAVGLKPSRLRGILASALKKLLTSGDAEVLREFFGDDNERDRKL